VIEHQYGITYQHSLSDLINLNTGADVPPNVFEAG
jgi:hypothetical protein